MSHLEQQVKLRITTDKKCIAESQVTFNEQGLEVDSNVRSGQFMKGVVIDTCIATLYNVVDDDDIRMRALIMSMMVTRGMAPSDAVSEYHKQPHPADVEDVDDIPF